MSRGKPQRKYQVLRTDKASIGKDLVVNLARISPAGVLWLVERGLDMRGYTNPGLSWVIWGVAAIWLWWFICKPGLMSRVLRQYGKSRFLYWIGFGLVGLSFGTKAWYSPWGQPAEVQPTNTEVVKAVRHASEHQADELSKLRAELSKITNGVEDRLKREYPLGYVMIAFSGHHKGVVPHSDIIDANWDDMTVSIDNKNTMMVEIPYLCDKRSGSSLMNCGLGTRAIPGAFFDWKFKDSLTMRLECLEANPVGIFAVLGFKEEIDKRKPQNGS